LEFGFIFPPEIDSQSQLLFLKYFKENKYFEKFQFLDDNQNFYTQFDNNENLFDSNSNTTTTSPSYIKVNINDKNFENNNFNIIKSNNSFSVSDSSRITANNNLTAVITGNQNNSKDENIEKVKKFLKRDENPNLNINLKNNTSNNEYVNPEENQIQNPGRDENQNLNINLKSDTSNNEYVNPEKNQSQNVSMEDNNTESTYYCKINIFKNETELEKERNKFIFESVHFYSIIFKSLTEYTIGFEYSGELYENKRITENDIYYENQFDDKFKEVSTYQYIINQSIIKTLSPNSQNFDISYTLLDRPSFNEKKKENNVQDLVPLFMLFYYVPCICNLLVLLVVEKESKIKESLVIIGLNKSVFWISWALTYTVIILLSSILVTTIIVLYKQYVYIHWSVLIVLLTIYGLSCCSFSFVLSTIISKSKTATTVGVMTIVLIFGIYFLDTYIKNISTLHNILMFIFSPMALLSLFNQLMVYDSQRILINIYNIFSKSDLRNSLIALFFSFMLYLIIAIYFDNVLPQGNNFHKKWHFFITDFFKNKKQKIMDSRHDNTFNPYIQEDPKDQKKTVQIKNIRKIFKVKGESIEILQNINFNAYYNEIFAILGHNGAGKTTLMNIMTGIISSTSGEIYYDNIPISGNETEVCKHFGYCPQFDTFNNSLTVGEHVRLFSGIKGIHVDIDSVLKNIDLLSKKNNFPKELSGGQRRKLCITLAFLGSPKYVFLDEPTTGLDPYSRKNIWELLLEKKEGRTIFVTTHYMDEADLLADRKMIISNGKISCLGSSLFLKQQFNMNYSIDINCKDIRDGLLTDKIIDKFCPGSANTKSIYNTNRQSTENRFNRPENENLDYIISYLLPIKYSKNFKYIFDNMNKIIKNHNNSIKKFSLTAPTLEELFINLENHKESQPQYQKAINTRMINLNSDEIGLVEGKESFFNMKNNNNKRSSLQQILAIVKLRLKIFLRNKTFAFIYTLLPILLSIFSIYLFSLILKQHSPDVVITHKPLNISPLLYENEKWFKEANITSPVSDYINTIESMNQLNMNTIDYSKDISISSGKDTSNLNYVGGFYGYNENQNLHFIIYRNITNSFVVPISINLISNAILEKNNINKRISVNYHPMNEYNAYYSIEDKEQHFNIVMETEKQNKEILVITCISLCISLCISVFGPYTVKEREDGITHQLFLNGTKRINYWISVIISDSICISVPMIIIIFAGYLNNISIFSPDIILFTLAMSIAWIFGCLLHQYVVSYFFRMYEKASTVIVVLNPILSIVFSIAIMSLANSNHTVFYDDIDTIKDIELKKNLKKARNILYIIYAILILFIPGYIILFYCKLSSFLMHKVVDFTEEDINIFMNSEKAVSIKSSISLNENQKSKLLTKIFIDSQKANLKDVFRYRDKFSILIIIFISVIVLYGIILIFLEKLNQKRIHKTNEYLPEERKGKDKMIENGPKDVLNEWKRVKQLLNYQQNNIELKIFELNKDFLMKSKDVNKRMVENKNKSNYSNKIIDESKKNGKFKNRNKGKSKKNRNAFEKMDNRLIYDEKKKRYINRIVDDVTFGVSRGECLGLLGPNGAGKTTSISMITGLLSHTHGVIKYGEKNLNETKFGDLSLGYCAQYDSLWELLTVKETIEFYLSICGYPRRDIPRYTKELIEACGIEIHTNKKICEISGGTKRKLSLIIVICSLPKYLILDEPSAGMDPFTRRYMWKLISRLKNTYNTATILTSHSTEEAEALCDRIAILIKGRLVCIDTPKSIKMNHSNTYTLEVFTTDPEFFEEKYVKEQNLFGLSSNEKYDVETSMNYQKYSVKIRIENIANIFSVMEYAKEHNIISQYNFGQYSLEQVFIDFVNQSK